MEIETSQLKASELGKIVYAYARFKGAEPGVKRLADQLVSKSPRINSSTNADETNHNTDQPCLTQCNG